VLSAEGRGHSCAPLHTDDLRALAARLLAESPYAMPIQEAQALIAERRGRLLARPAASTPNLESDLTKPDPPITPHVLEPEKFAEHFLRTHAPSPPKKKPARRNPRSPACVSSMVVGISKSDELINAVH
jgi:hypothetical protein